MHGCNAQGCVYTSVSARHESVFCCVCVCALCHRVMPGVCVLQGCVAVCLPGCEHTVCMCVCVYTSCSKVTVRVFLCVSRGVCVRAHPTCVHTRDGALQGAPQLCVHRGCVTAGAPVPCAHPQCGSWGCAAGGAAVRTGAAYRRARMFPAGPDAAVPCRSVPYRAD